MAGIHEMRQQGLQAKLEKDMVPEHALCPT